MWLQAEGHVPTVCALVERVRSLWLDRFHSSLVSSAAARLILPLLILVTGQ